MEEARVRDILRVLCRIPIERGQLVLYRLAVEHAEAGFTSTTIKQLLHLDQAQHRGLMAALTVRINKTPRETSRDKKPGLGMLFTQTWSGEYTYRPRPELLEAVRRLLPLDALMKRPIDEVVGTTVLALTLPEGVPTQPPDPAPAPPPPRSTQPFEALLDALDAAELVYPSELVANLLLALQVKRFVILTGISGTGKTRIAQVLADRFSVRRRIEAPADPGDQAALVTVMPYMQKYHRMILPQALAAQVPGLPTTRGSGTLKAKWPGGTIDLSVYVLEAVQVMFRGPLRAWFDATFKEGETFLARLDGPADGPPDTLVLSTAPKAIEREERVPNTVVMAVRPDWTDHRGLLGSYNPLTRQYLTTPFLRLLLRARQEYEREGTKAAPFFLVLDEMNLARVEHYFADFLSALESGEPLHLHDSAEIEEGLADTEEAATPVPRQLTIPPNVFFLGTVNVDESTYMFSPKVLDRAFTIELNSVDLDGLSSGVERGGDLALTKWLGRLDAPQRPGRADWTWLATQEDGALARQVKAFHDLLAHHNRHFGYRVAGELARFVRLAAEQAEEPGSAAWAALDLALLQKVLVKLHGTRHELAAILDALLRFTLFGADGEAELADLSLWDYKPAEAVVRRKGESSDIEAVFPRSAAKLWRMRNRLLETGFTSWIE
jgi:5-methylcytosine-specific restriction protein B